MDRHAEKLRTFAHLAGLLADELPGEVLERRVRILVGDNVLDTPAGQVLVLTVARLAPRLCHRIDFVCPQAAAISRLRALLAAPEFSSDSLAHLARLVWPDGMFTASAGDPVEIVLGIGAPGDISAGVAPTGAVVLSDRAAQVENGDGIYGALASAALACAQLVARLYPEIVPATVEPEIRLDRGPFGGQLDQIAGELKRPFLAGVGAVGCALIYALVATGATGRILLLDPDTVKDSNLMRYVLFDSRHLNQPKVSAAASLVEESGIDLIVEKDSVVLQEYLENHEDERKNAELVISAVDTYQARREIAGWLPRNILNAGTNPRDFTISRHCFADGYACLACLYPARPDEAALASVIARELGLPQAETENLQRRKKGLTRAQLEQVALAREAPTDRYLEYEGEPIDSFYNKEFCAQLAVPTARGQAVAPLAHGSALAGFLLAQTLTATALGDDHHFRMDIMSGLNHPLRRSPRQRADCPICGRSAIRAVYAARWSSVQA
jgi:molybdopterin/thiamine biosynthesis adenylyltransferase